MVLSSSCSSTVVSVLSVSVVVTSGVDSSVTVEESFDSVVVDDSFDSVVVNDSFDLEVVVTESADVVVVVFGVVVDSTVVEDSSSLKSRLLKLQTQL